MYFQCDIRDKCVVCLALCFCGTLFILSGTGGALFRPSIKLLFARVVFLRTSRKSISHVNIQVNRRRWHIWGYASLIESWFFGDGVLWAVLGGSACTHEGSLGAHFVCGFRFQITLNFGLWCVNSDARCAIAISCTINRVRYPDLKYCWLYFPEIEKVVGIAPTCSWA